MLADFNFASVADVRVGAGSSAELGAMANKLGISHALIVTDAGILKFGLLGPALDSLTDQKIAATVFSEVLADPPESVVLAALSVAREAGCDGVIGFGGGSSMDVAKLLAVLLVGNQSLVDIYGVDQVSGGRLPLIQVPTTAGTGSEATMVSIVTTGETTKAGVVSRVMLADTIVLDAALTIDLPPHITAATGIDAMVHGIEAYTSLRLKNPVSDMLAKEALRLISQNIMRAVADGTDLGAREAMLLGAMLAGQAFANAPVAAVHALAYPLGGNYHIAHGLSNSLVLPHVLRFNAPEAGHLYRELAPIILASTASYRDVGEAAEALADYFLRLATDLGLPTTLQEMGIDRDQLPKLAAEALMQQRLLVNNPRPVTLADALAIYHQAY
ncbi:MAG: iron-containing alcohol dehydrogenase [Porticoccaceae bacterium]|nr:iron-containing alcohol dehydrogenase [Porticoccaceae bacterium]